MFGHVAIWDGDGSGALDNVNETILALRHGDMVDPNVGGPEDGDGITITPCPLSNMVHGVSYQATIPGLNVLNAKPVDDDIVHELQGDSGTVLDLNIGSTTINGLVGGDHQLLLQDNDHVALECDPQWAFLDGTIA